MKSINLIYLTLAIAFLIDYTNQVSLSECLPEHSTVCQYSNSTKSCCPVKEATCCQDSDFCCPKGFNCDTKNKRCVKDSMYIPFYLRTKQIDSLVVNLEPVGKDILCPDNQTSCKDTQTCCLFGDNDYGCCPLSHAICCEDKIHCCPKNYNCNPTQGKCDRNKTETNEMISIDWFKKQPGKKVKDVECPDGISACPSGSTCCQLSSGDYGCCPLPEAVCCSDHLHCCPKGYTCDIKDGRCNKQGVSLPFYHKIKAAKVQKRQVNVTIECPGGQAECPAATTCCQLVSGEWGCCPIPNAVCCSDHLHCCPEGYTCDVEHGRCKKGNMAIPFLPKTKSFKKQEPNQECPDGESECPKDTTCCQLESGEWGCCPLPNAVCCSDHLHCCPHGYTCDLKDGRCSKGEISIPFFKKIMSKFIKKNFDSIIQLEQQGVNNAVKIPQINFSFNATSVVCPDGCSFCPNKFTCCIMSSGAYGCCPIPNAICCEDQLHCCPENTKCNLQKQSCDSNSNGNKIISWLEKIPSKLLYNRQKNNQKVANDPILCEDNVTTCDPLKTCCKMSDGSYGCCPYADGVCCTELSFCCPSNTVCGKMVGECLPKNQMEMIEMRANKKQENKCTNGCEGTCCDRPDGDSVCCPYSNGTCCGTHGFCCPPKYTCNPKDESCTYQDPDAVEATRIFLNKIVSKRSANTYPGQLEDSMVECKDAVHYCPDSSTCCKSGDSFGCCSIKNAVCCDDGINCCPVGYDCPLPGKTSCTKRK